MFCEEVVQGCWSVVGKSCGVDLAAASEGPGNAGLGANDIVLVGITLSGSGSGEGNLQS